MASKEIIRDFESWHAFRETMEPLKAGGRCSGTGRWAGGVANVGEALAIADRGWPEGMERVQSISLPVVNTIARMHAPTGGWGWDVTGGAYDVGEFIQGVPECWLTREAPRTAPVVDIAINTVSSAGVSTEAIEMRGAACVALALTLQGAGYVVQIHAIEGMHINDTDVWHRILLTDPTGGPVDVDRILYSLAHPSAARMLGYTLGTHMAGADIERAQWIGWPANQSRDALPESIAHWKGDIYLAPPFLDDANWANPESVTRWVASQYERLSAGGDAEIEVEE